jgi:hypothetical protein
MFYYLPLPPTSQGKDVKREKQKNITLYESILYKSKKIFSGNKSHLLWPIFLQNILLYPICTMSLRIQTDIQTDV